MTLEDILELPSGTRIRTKLNFASVSMTPWFTGCIRSNTRNRGDKYVRVTIDKDDGGSSHWICYITEENKDYFQLYDPEWDLRDNI